MTEPAGGGAEPPDAPGTTDTLETPERLVRRLQWQVVRRLDGILQGDHRTLFRGTGVDVADLREYVPGDDLRHLDWNVTARLDTPYVRRYLEDREVTAWLLVDHSASMAFGRAGRTKDVVAAEIATVLAQVLTRGGNPVGLMVLGDEPGVVEDVVPPASGRRQVLRIARLLLDRRGRDAVRRPAAGAAGRTDLGSLLRTAAAVVRRRALVVVLSDFSSQDGWERPLGMLARRHDVVALRVRDPRERELPLAGVLHLEDAETGEQVVVDTADPVLRARLLELAEAEQASLEEAARGAGVLLHTVDTDDDLVAALVRVAGLRARVRSGAGARR